MQGTAYANPARPSEADSALCTIGQMNNPLE